MIRFLIRGLVGLLVVITFFILAGRGNEMLLNNEEILLHNIQEGNMEDHCIKWIREKYYNRNIIFKSMIKEKIGGLDSIHGELQMGGNKEYFCIKVDEDNFKTRGGLSQLLVGDEISYNEEGIGTIYK